MNDNGLKPRVKMKLPKKIQVAGTDIDVLIVDDIEGGLMGESLLYSSTIKIARKAKGYPQSDSTMLNTFVHECVHMILDSMGDTELSGNEKFVNTFAGFTTEIIRSIMRESNEQNVQTPSNV